MGDSTINIHTQRENLLFQPVHFPSATCKVEDVVTREVGEEIVLHGYLGTQRQAGRNLLFAELRSTTLSHSIQLVASNKTSSEERSVFEKLSGLNIETPVAIEGKIKTRKAKASSSKVEEGAVQQVTEVEIELAKVSPLNHFPKDIMVTQDSVFSAEQRHLQLRMEKSLRDALAFRSKAASILRTELCEGKEFVEIETPLLFKSTPEGAREFLVPTRTPGLAYALPQSPQQYKQILMASGIPRYVQFAKCFRDEDLRADRQPEFTQVDLEMSFATGEDVMNTVESVVKTLWQKLLGISHQEPFPRLSYEDAMSNYGSDKPDVRLGSKISRVEYMLPVDLIRKIGPLHDPIVEMLKIPISADAKETRGFVTKFMDSSEAKPFNENPEGQPGIFICDPRKPLSGLSVFGFEAAETIEETLDLEEGDLVVLQARKNAPHAGGSTPLGNLRLALHKFAVQHNYMPVPQGFEFLWITDFPLFSPSVANEPGQGGAAGFSSTHHPFTAPKTAEDVDLLLTDPAAVKAEHYDLVVNGVELGGGSRRIHSAAMQQFVLREVLKMSEERLKDFDHLIEVLRAGCPPHAGMALGFDRLIAVMLGKESVRDVIAFPKSGRGEDLLVKSPTRMTEDQLKTYHLKLRE
ncbi:aspartyl-tRNA synthetase [Aureobasidium namibiae CBS 147.97]|uniref:Aspartyl-tRNA synthetase n=1 Tax=Aureobasidium namibiae CBS 147.97 TaxID=1043004 RepID=A0A074X1D2_9PEZI